MQPDRFERSTSSGSRLGLVRSAPAGRGDSLSGVSVDAFAASISLRLAATLNLRRTLGLVLALAVPGLADWASVQLSDGSAVRGGSAFGGRPAQFWSAADAADAARTDAVDELAKDGEVPTELLVPLQARGRELGRLTLLCGPRATFDEHTRRLVTELGTRAALALDAARVYEERTTLATTLRDSLRPDQLPRLPFARFGARYRAAEEATEIGGDFYDVYRGPGQAWWFAMGDVCGKGVDAAVLTGRVRSALHMTALTGREPDGVLSLLNEVMLLEGGTSFVTLVVGQLGAAPEPGAVDLHLSGGGHLPPLVLRADGSVEPVGTGGVLVGMLPEARFRPTDLRLHPGEVCLLYTDGVIEAADRTGQMFAQERLERLLADCVGMPPQAVAERVEQNVLEHLDGLPHDDIAVLVIGPEDVGPGGSEQGDR